MSNKRPATEAADSSRPSKRVTLRADSLAVEGSTVLDILDGERSLLTDDQKTQLTIAAAATYGRGGRGTVELGTANVAALYPDPPFDAILVSARRQLAECDTEEERQDVRSRRDSLLEVLDAARGRNSVLTNELREAGLDWIWNRARTEERHFFENLRRKREEARRKAQDEAAMLNDIEEIAQRLLKERAQGTELRLTTPEIHHIYGEATEIVNRLRTTASPPNQLPTPPSETDTQASVALNLVPDPNGLGFIYDADVSSSDSGSDQGQAAPAPPQLRLVGRVPLDPAHPDHDADLVAALGGQSTRFKILGYTQGNIERPENYWEDLETFGDEEGPRFSNSQIRFDRHSDYARGVSYNKNGLRKGEMPEFHGILSAKERLGVSKKVGGKDNLGKAHVLFRFEILEACREFGYVNDMKKNHKPRFELLVRSILRSTTILPAGIKRALMYGMPVLDEELPADNADSLLSELWNHDRRFYWHPWEYYVNDTCRSVMDSYNAGLRMIEQRNAAQAGDQLAFGHTPVLNRWYKSAENTQPFPVREFDIPGAPDIDHLTGHPYGALNANGQPFPKRTRPQKTPAPAPPAPAAPAPAPPGGSN